MRGAEFVAKRFVLGPGWVVLPGLVSSVVIGLMLFLWHRDSLTRSFQVSASTISPTLPESFVTSTEPNLGPRHQLSYDQWVQLLAREATAIARRQPDQLQILAGDSLSLWFPSGLLPDQATWLNQGISGETSYGLLRRVKHFDLTQPRVIFVMIGINDLIQGVQEETLKANYREIIQHLKTAHPQTRIVVQSILPHGGDRARQRYLAAAAMAPNALSPERPLWVDRLPAIPNQRIQTLNHQLAELAQLENVEFLDLYPFFVGADGLLQPELTTDGLHLSAEGYAVWRSQLEQVMASSPQRRGSP